MIDENRYIKNGFLEAMGQIRLSGEESQVFWVVIRKTHGANRKEAQISLSQFVLATKIIKQGVCRAIRRLIAKDMIIKDNSEEIPSYRIQANVKEWKPLKKRNSLSNGIWIR